MTMAQPVNLKIEKILNKLLEPNFKPKDDAYLNLLLNHLTNISNDDKNAVGQQEATKELLLNWMKRAISNWDETKTISSAITFTFTLNLMGYLSRDELIFLKLNKEGLLERLLAITMNYFKYSGIQPNIELAYIKLLSSCLNHVIGLQWIISNKNWHFVMRSSLNYNNVYISKEGYEFIASLLEKSTKVDSVNAKNILKYILAPLINAGSIQTHECGTTIVMNEEVLYLSITPILFLLTRMFEIFIDSNNQGNIKEIIMILQENFHFDKMMKILTTSVRKEEFSFNLHKLYIIWNFLTIYIKYGENPIAFHQKIDKQILEIYYDASSRLNMVDMLKLLHMSLVYWNNVKSRVSSILDSNLSEKSLDKQLLVLQMSPVSTVGKNEDEEEEHSRIVCTQKFFDQITPHTLRVRYKWRTHLKQAFSFNDGILALKYILHSRKYYSRENAVLAFQILIYIVKDVTDILNKRPDFINVFLNQSDLVMLLLECIKVIVDEFTITWKDSVESLCLIQTTHALIKVTIWPPKIIISSLQLIEKALVKYMTPEMALLMDTTEDSAIYHLLSILKIKLPNFDWEVRESAIELIRTITISTYTKFSSLGKILMINEFPTTILQMATTDGNSCVRATSLKCLQEMVKVNELWDVLIHKGHILNPLNHIMTSNASNQNQSHFQDVHNKEIVTRILYVEKDGVVQTEAVSLIDSIHKNHELPEYILSSFYDTMYHVVVADLHWKTRVNALKFWKNVIDKHLTQQGMIDEKFPKFIFSKEMRKIINLTPLQVKMRLMKVLQQLSEIGCLSSLQFAIQDDSDKEVTKHASTAINDFAKFLKEYNITISDVSSHSAISNSSYHSPQSDSPKSRPSTGSEDDTKYISYSSSNDSVMDEVIDSLDTNLLESIFTSLDQASDDNVEMQTRKMVSPKEFIEFVYSDFACRVNQNSSWIAGVDSFDSLLDDILREYEVNDIDEMDFY